MKIAKASIGQPGKTFLKSAQHVRILDKRGNYLRSVLVGLQFGIFHLPYELVAIVIWPLIRNIITAIFSATSNLMFVLQAACIAIYMGFSGVLEATDEPISIEFDEE